MTNEELQEIRDRLETIPKLVEDTSLDHPNIHRWTTDFTGPLGLPQPRLVTVAYPVSRAFADWAIAARNNDIPALLAHVDTLQAALTAHEKHARVALADIRAAKKFFDDITGDDMSNTAALLWNRLTSAETEIEAIRGADDEKAS